jgi:hypothetical protein
MHYYNVIKEYLLKKKKQGPMDERETGPCMSGTCVFFQLSPALNIAGPGIHFR